jgi:NTP pyrophosphatase (non-canonical NTP hydrolase)
MNIKEMQEEVCEWAYGKGWEPDPDRSFADECALMHSEVSEALEAYRTWRFEDATRNAHGMADGAYLPTAPAKPEGVGSELADVLVRLMHYTGMRGWTIDIAYQLPDRIKVKCMTFGGECTVMHRIISNADAAFDFDLHNMVQEHLSALYAMLLYSCELHGYDLEWEYRRKMYYNCTRAWRHGNRTM